MIDLESDDLRMGIQQRFDLRPRRRGAGQHQGTQVLRRQTSFSTKRLAAAGSPPREGNGHTQRMLEPLRAQLSPQAAAPDIRSCRGRSALYQRVAGRDVPLLVQVRMGVEQLLRQPRGERSGDGPILGGERPQVRGWRFR